MIREASKRFMHASRKGTVNLITEDGRMIQVEPGRLSESDQAFSKRNSVSSGNQPSLLSFACVPVRVPSGDVEEVPTCLNANSHARERYEVDVGDDQIVFPAQLTKTQKHVLELLEVPLAAYQ